MVAGNPAVCVAMTQNVGVLLRIKSLYRNGRVGSALVCLCSQLVLAQPDGLCDRPAPMGAGGAIPSSSSKDLQTETHETASEVAPLNPLSLGTMHQLKRSQFTAGFVGLAGRKK